MLLYYNDMLCHTQKKNIAKIGALAGLAGGLAEVIWIVLFSNLNASDASIVASGVTQSVGLGQLNTLALVPLGIAIHMSLAIVLGISVSVLLRFLEPRLFNKFFELLIVLAILIAIWGLNFFVILPAINPAFVNIVPLPASLLSKIFFGCAAAWVFLARKINV